MSRPPNTTTAPTGSIAPLGIRLLPELRKRIEDSARANGRSMNAEVSARLSSSFDGGSPLLPFAVQQAVDHMVEETGCTPAQALERLVLAGQANGGQVLSVRIGPNTTVAQVKAMLDEAFKHVQPTANLVIERE